MPAFFPKNPAGIRAQREEARTAEEAAEQYLRANRWPGAKVHRLVFEFGVTVALFTDQVNRPHRAYLMMRPEYIRKGQVDPAPDVEVWMGWHV